MKLYEILGVAPTATMKEIKTAYHLLAKKYHPDKHSNTVWAVERMKKLNFAKDILLNEYERAKYDQDPHLLNAKFEDFIVETGIVKKAFKNKPEKDNDRKFSMFQIGMLGLLSLIVLLLAINLFSLKENKTPVIALDTNTGDESVVDTSKHMIEDTPAPDIVTKIVIPHRYPESSVENYSRVEASTLPVNNLSETSFTTPKNSIVKETYTGQPQKGFITLGSTKDEVKTIMGTPSAIDKYSNNWRYEFSTINFDEANKVESWSDISNNLKTSLGVPTSSASFITVGSTKDDVNAVMGTPSAIDKYSNSWRYEFSTINFDETDKVKTWSDISENLKVSIKKSDKPLSNFTIGSTKEEVASAMGTPSAIDKYSNNWRYEFSTISFDETDKVESWSDLSGNLKVSL